VRRPSANHAGRLSELVPELRRRGVHDALLGTLDQELA